MISPRGLKQRKAQGSQILRKVGVAANQDHIIRATNTHRAHPNRDRVKIALEVSSIHANKTTAELRSKRAI